MLRNFANKDFALYVIRRSFILCKNEWSSCLIIVNTHYDFAQHHMIGVTVHTVIM